MLEKEAKNRSGDQCAIQSEIDAIVESTQPGFRPEEYPYNVEQLGTKDDDTDHPQRKAIPFQGVLPIHGLDVRWNGQKFCQLVFHFSNSTFFHVPSSYSFVVPRGYLIEWTDSIWEGAFIHYSDFGWDGTFMG